MRKKKQVIPKNYLEQIPTHDLQWSVDKDEKVVLHIENKGAFNRIAQKLFKKPTAFALIGLNVHFLTVAENEHPLWIT